MTETQQPDRHPYIVMFGKPLKDAKDVYMRHRPTKGDSWIDADMGYLIGKLDEEVKEFFADTTSYEELLDVINMSLMVATKMRLEQKKGGKQNGKAN